MNNNYRGKLLRLVKIAAAGSSSPESPHITKPATTTIQELQKSGKEEKRFRQHPIPNLWIPEIQHRISKVNPEMVYQETDVPPPPPSPKSDQSPEKSPGNSPRIRLKDGRYLAYREEGVPKNKAKYKIIIVHGFGSSKEMSFNAPQEMIEDLGIYFLLFDRAGYGESDPNPKRSVKSEALDIQQLADELEIGPKFYVIGVSMGSYPIWSCIRHIPNRLAGAALIVPVVNYRWHSLPKKLIREDYRRKLVQWTLRFSKFAPGLLHWWCTQKWIPSTSVLEKNPTFFNTHDIEVLKRIPGFPMLSKDNLQNREVFDTLRHDFMVAFGDWDFDPTDLSNPFPQDESSVHIWQGYEDKVVPFQLQRHISRNLPWIRYHEVPGGGHLIVHYNGLCEAVLKALLLGEEPLTLDHIHP
ncbi:hypothetical protein Tsubulata_043953 [Turnera subulata]|uniref:AB hydrolase-1 domain-containing protein n=1 Tax=Turnera subulata TaxID=218843 RepID=A0A9Q0JLG8_9ROSI|nr:hypothetical protein Tsubulata_043953 [Turnera subulata]